MWVQKEMGKGWRWLGFWALCHFWLGKRRAERSQAGWASGTGEPGLAGRRALGELGSDGRLGAVVIPGQGSHLQGRV